MGMSGLFDGFVDQNTLNSTCKSQEGHLLEHECLVLVMKSFSQGKNYISAVDVVSEFIW